MPLSSFAKKFVTAGLCAMLAAGMLGLAGCSSSSSSSSSSAATSSSASSSASSAASSAAQAQSEASMSGIHHALIEVEGYEPITVTLDADSAPITVTNFANLVENGYYDGLTFYRIQDGFVMQGGTKGNTASGSDASLTPIVGEFSSNGYDNALADEFGVGTIAMARTSDPDSATSTFFITLADNATVGASLDGAYAAFGTIDAADMAIVDQIIADHLANVDASSAMGMITDEAGQPVIKSITMVD